MDAAARRLLPPRLAQVARYCAQVGIFCAGVWGKGAQQMRTRQQSPRPCARCRTTRARLER